MRQLHLIVPGLAAWRASLHHDRVTLPALEKLLARGTPTHGETSLAESLCHAYGIPAQQDTPLAPLCAAWDGLAVGNTPWLRADPVHLQIGMRGMTLHTAAHIGLPASDATALAASLAPLFAEIGWQLHAPHPQRWYARLPHGLDLATTPLDFVATRHINTALPTGGSAAAVMQLLNQVQMALHDHPINQAREMRGEKPVNSLWLWGGGTLPEVPRRWSRVYADQAEAQALAAHTGSPAAPCPARLLDLPHSHDALVILPEWPPHATPDETAQLDHLWFAPLLSHLRLGRIRRASLILAGAEGVSTQLRAWDALKFWKKV